MSRVADAPSEGGKPERLDESGVGAGAIRSGADSGELGLRTRSHTLLASGPWKAFRVLLDTALLVLAVVAARIGADAADLSADGRTLVLAFPPLTLALLALRGAYRRRMELDIAEGVIRVMFATSVVAIGLVAVSAFAEPNDNVAPLVTRAWVFGAVYLSLGQAVLGLTERRARATGALTKPTLVVGAGEVGTHVERLLSKRPDLGLRMVGYLDADPIPHERVPGRRAPILGAPEDFARIAEQTGAQHVVLTFTSSPDSVLMPLIRACQERGIEVLLVPRLFESVNLRLRLEQLGDLPLVQLDWVDPKGWQFAIKHFLDRVVSALLLVLLAPLMLAIAAAIKLNSRGPVLFRQYRVGRDGRRFHMLKFRSMAVSDDPDTAPETPEGIAPGGVDGEDTRTAVGRFIRRWSLDELPQLVNVLRGEMSLIGPRPERPEYVERFDEQVRRYSDRHRVKSGISGLAQVQGYRGRTALAERVAADNWYIANWSASLDLRILLMTFWVLFRRAE